MTVQSSLLGGKESATGSGGIATPTGEWSWIREEASETRSWVYRLVAVLIALGIGAIYLVVTIHVPDILGLVLGASFSSGPGLQELVVLATPFFLTGMAVQIPRRVGLWNIGGEGQFFAGAWLATAFAFALPHAPGWALIVGMLVAGAVGGAIWMVIPTLAKALLNVNEIITTLMLNLVATFWVAYWITGPWRYASTQGGTIDSRFLPTQSNLPLVHLSGGLDSGLIFAVLITVAVGLLIRYSIFGYKTRVVGSGRSVAAYAGVPVRRIVAMSLLVGGAMAGVGGVLQLIGNSHQLTPGLSDNPG
ncbi:MAG: ABC transporter permease, partial [Acidimicrobiales bacterium]